MSGRHEPRCCHQRLRQALLKARHLWIMKKRLTEDSSNSYLNIGCRAKDLRFARSLEMSKLQHKGTEGSLLCGTGIVNLIQARTGPVAIWCGSWQRVKLVHRMGLTSYTSLNADCLVSLSAAAAMYFSMRPIGKRNGLGASSSISKEYHSEKSCSIQFLETAKSTGTSPVT